MAETWLARAKAAPAGSEIAEARAVPTRRVSFEESLQSLTKHYAADGDLILSHMFASLSAVFPDGEDFFVRSVRHYRGEISDPALKQQVSGFIGQEATHRRIHALFNGHLQSQGYFNQIEQRAQQHGIGVNQYDHAELRRRLNSYIVNFNEQRDSLAVPNVHPYVRIVGFEKEPLR